MSEQHRYYWLKLYDDIFTSKRIKKLRKLAGGDTYFIIYLKLQFIAMKNDGVIKFTGLEQDFAEELALDIDEEADNIRVTMNYLLSCGLAETSDNVDFFFPYSQICTGSETASTQRSRECRKRQKALQCNTNATQLQQPCNVEKEKEIEKDIEIDTDIEKEKECKHAHGEFSNVFLTDKELMKLQERYPDEYESKIEELSVYMAKKNKRYNSHYATILSWIRKDTKEELPF